MAEAVKPFPNPRDHSRAGQAEEAVVGPLVAQGAAQAEQRHRPLIVESEGAETESLSTGPEALKTVDSEARVEILHLFPELASIHYDRLPDPVRPILSGLQGRKLANRHASKKSIWRSNVSRK